MLEIILKEIINGAAVGASLYKVVKEIAGKNKIDNLNALYKDVIPGINEKKINVDQ